MKIEIISDSSQGFGILLIDGEEWAKVYRRYFFRKIKTLSKDLTLDEIYKALDKISFESGQTYALNLIAYRPRTEKELASKLRERLIPSAQIDQILEKCRTWGYLNDEEELTRFIASEIRNGRGPYLIAQKVQNRFGLSPPPNFYPRDEQQSIIETLATNKSREPRIRFLQRRGFPIDLILTSI